MSSRLHDPNVRRWLLWGTLAAVFLLVNVYRRPKYASPERLKGNGRGVIDTTGSVGPPSPPGAPSPWVWGI